MASGLKRPLFFALLWLGAIGAFCSSGNARDASRKEGDFIARNFPFKNG